MFTGKIPSGTLFPGRQSDGRAHGRRAMLRASATGLAGLTGLAALPGAAALPGGNAKAKSTILCLSTAQLIAWRNLGSRSTGAPSESGLS